MLRKNLGPMSVMGFARYNAKAGVDTGELILAARRWQHEFLGNQPGIAMHCFLGNAAGGFADAILATDESAFAAMGEAHMQAPSSKAFMGMLDIESIRLCRNVLLKDLGTIPTDFSAIEFGTFSPKPNSDFSEKRLLDASEAVETGYLAKFPESRAHLMGKVDEATYSEICFVETSGAAREICGGYLGNDVCAPLLDLFDPKKC